MLKLYRMKEDDSRFELKKNDIVLVETNYDWDPDKVICVGVLQIKNDNSLYKHQIKKISNDELRKLGKSKEIGEI